MNNSIKQSSGRHKFGVLVELKKNKTLFLMILPAVVFFVVFHYVTMGGIVLAFKKFNYTDGFFGSPWIGFDNFKFLFSSGTLWRITQNTVLYNLAFIIFDTVLQVGVAVLLNEIGTKWVQRLAQSTMFLPYFISFVLLGAFVYNIFNYEYGVLNNILTEIGLPPADVYGNKGVWKYILLFFHEWKGLGYGVVIYLATITGLGTEYYEAAKIDGASKWQEIRCITLPLLKPTIIILSMFAIGKIMKGQFDLFYQIIGNNGTLFEQTDIIDTYVFRSLTQVFDPGLGTAAGLYQSVFGFILIMTVNIIIKKIQPEYALF